MESFCSVWLFNIGGLFCLFKALIDFYNVFSHTFRKVAFETASILNAGSYLSFDSNIASNPKNSLKVAGSLKNETLIVIKSDLMKYNDSGFVLSQVSNKLPESNTLNIDKPANSFMMEGSHVCNDSTAISGVSLAIGAKSIMGKLVNQSGFKLPKILSQSNNKDDLLEIKVKPKRLSMEIGSGKTIFHKNNPNKRRNMNAKTVFKYNDNCEYEDNISEFPNEKVKACCNQCSII